MLGWSGGGALQSRQQCDWPTAARQSFGEAEATKPISRFFSWIEQKQEFSGVAAGSGLHKESEALTWQQD